jgi:hypothetical protein
MGSPRPDTIGSKGALILSDSARRIDAYLQERLEDYIAETAKLCAQPSISAKGEGVLECAELVSSFYSRWTPAGCRVDIMSFRQPDRIRDSAAVSVAPRRLALAVQVE